MTPSPYPPPVPAAPPSKSRMWIFVAIAAVAFTCLCCIPGAIGAWLGTLPESGVLTDNQLDERSRKQIARHVTLERDEAIVCYYDATLKVDGTEASLLTSSRLVTWKGSLTSEMAVGDIAALGWTKESLQGDVITATDTTGRIMTVIVAPMNDGHVFREALERVTGHVSNQGARPDQLLDTPVPDDEPVVAQPPVHEAPPTRKKRK